MNELTPGEAGSSRLALTIAKRVLRQPAMSTLRDALETNENLKVFCGFLAREVIGEILHEFSPHLFPAVPFRQTPGQRGKQDGMIASVGKLEDLY